MSVERAEGEVPGGVGGGGEAGPPHGGGPGCDLLGEVGEEGLRRGGSTSLG